MSNNIPVYINMYFGGILKNDLITKKFINFEGLTVKRRFIFTKKYRIIWSLDSGNIWKIIFCKLKNMSSPQNFFASIQYDNSTFQKKDIFTIKVI